jgi:hypothetical protein
MSEALNSQWQLSHCVGSEKVGKSSSEVSDFARSDRQTVLNECALRMLSPDKQRRRKKERANAARQKIQLPPPYQLSSCALPAPRAPQGQTKASTRSNPPSRNRWRRTCESETGQYEEGSEGRREKTHVNLAAAASISAGLLVGSPAAAASTRRAVRHSFSSCFGGKEEDQWVVGNVGGRRAYANEPGSRAATRTLVS